MKENYNFEFWRWNFNCDNFTLKHANIIMGIISGGRLNRDMVFSSYGNITFDPTDNAHRYPNIEEIDGYNKSKANCLIYNLTETEKNPNLFDKLFIYHSNGSQHGFYGYVFYNTTTKEIIHKYFVEYEYEDLCKCLNVSFNLLKSKPIFDYYSNRFNKAKYANSSAIPSLKDEMEFWENYNNLLNKYI